MCILDPKIDRNRGRRRAGVVSCFLVASIILPLSISGIWQTQAQEREKSDKEKKEAQFKKQETQLKEKEMQLKAKQMELQKRMEGMSAEEREKFEQEMKLKKEMSKLSSEEKINLSWKKISQSEGSAAVLVHDAIVEDGPDAGVKLAMKLHESGDEEYYFKEGEFNTLGYYFLFDKKIDEAIAVFKINTKAFPESWNVYDSLGEGCLAAGNYDCARKNYEKSIAMNPDNENGKKMLAQIEKKSNLAKTHVSSEEGEDE